MERPCDSPLALPLQQGGLWRLARLVLPALGLLASFGWALPLWAAEAPGGPASEADMTLYTRMAAVNVCISRAAEIPFDKAVAIAGETMAQVIQHQHGGAIAQVGTAPLQLDDLRKGSINSAVLGAAEVCPERVPEEVRRNVAAAVERSAGAEAVPPPPRPDPQPAPQRP